MAGLISPKDGCSGEGVCGCCTILVDGKARLSCRMAVKDVADKAVTTLEGLSGAERLGHLQMALFEHRWEQTLLQPTFVTDFPLDVSPLSRKKDADPSLVDRFELYITGREIANAFSELTDPADQEARFRAQGEAKAKGDDEAMPYDADYVRALEFGMPPTAGEGIGIDRLVMLLTDSPSIRDVILFPLLKTDAQGT